MEKSHCDWLHCQASDIDTERVEKPMTNPNLDRRGRARGQVYWEETSWALHLVATNEENASMDVAFHWLPTLGNSERKASDKDLIPETGEPVSWQRYRHWQSLGEGNYLHCEKSVIRFGQIFTIPTDDPLNNPLQSKGICDGSWLALQGADCFSRLPMGLFWLVWAYNPRSEAPIFRQIMPIRQS